jgi:hypothetical protein
MTLDPGVPESLESPPTTIAAASIAPGCSAIRQVDVCDSGRRIANGLGRPSNMPKKVVERIKRERAAGKTLAEIAERLNGDGVPTAQGGRRWYPATVRYTLGRAPRKR